MAFSWLPLFGNVLDAAFGLGSTKSQVGGATQAAAELEKYNREAYNYLTERAQQGRNDILEQNALGKEYLEPYINNGRLANNTLTGEVVNGGLNRPFTLNDLTLDPGYQFRLGEGQKATLANRPGQYFSGGTQKALARYNQNFASAEFQNAYNRFTDTQDRRYKQLFELGGQGLNASTTAANMNQRTGESLLNEALPTAALGGSYLTNIGEAQASARAQRGSAYGNLYNDIAGNAQSVLGEYGPKIEDFFKRRRRTAPVWSTGE